MSQDPNPLNQEVALSVQLKENGVSAGARSRTVSAIDYFLGGVIAIPAAYVDRLRKRVEAETETKEKLQHAESNAAIEKLRNDPAFGDRMFENFLRKQAREQFNRDQIAHKAVQYVKNESDDTDHEEDNIIKDDWLNIFEHYAKNASSENLQDMWAKVLSGEIRKPGTFSLATIRFISELDAEIAKKFQDTALYRLPEGVLLKPTNLEGEKLLNYSFLEEVGLLQEVHGPVGTDLPEQENGNCYFRIGGVLLIARSKAKIRLSFILMTRTGREIASILPKQTDHRIAQFVADHIADKCEEVSINRITHESKKGKLWHMPLEKRK